MMVSIENSIGYHRTLLDLAEFAERLTAIGGHQSCVAGVIDGMRRFSQLVTYVDGRVPAFGDDNRELNPASSASLAPYSAGELTVLTKAGYAFDGIEWLIDPAFYSHDPAHRVASYLRSAVAHNAVVLPERAYSIAPGKAWLSGGSENNTFRIHGRHQSYAGVDVQRDVQGDFRRLDLRFVERIVPPPNLAQVALLMLHCGDGVCVQRTGPSLKLTHPASDYALIILLPDDRIEIAHGEVNDVRVRGVAGTNFTQHTAIETISCELASREASWSIVAERLGKS
jgi:hypothetical protein